MATLENLVSQLGQDLKMEDFFSTTPTGVYTLPFEDDIEVQITQTPQSYVFKGIIGPLPKESKDVFLIKVMEANLFGIGTRNAIIGLSEDENLLTLSAELDYNSSYREFKEKIEDFVSVIDFWRNKASK